MDRSGDSHKGENGKVAVIGGSRFVHGAPIFSALGSEASGVDLVYLCVPAAHEDVAKNASLNFQVRPFGDDALDLPDVDMIMELLASMDCAVLGPGLWPDKETLDAVYRIIAGSPCPLILDAAALQEKTLSLVRGKSCILTPHRGELERMGVDIEDVARVSADSGVVIHVKGAVDHVALPSGETRDIEGGNAGLTVGGTGDALAGIIAGLLAQRLDPEVACVTASTVLKRAGERLFEDYGYAYTTRQVIASIPSTLREISPPES